MEENRLILENGLLPLAICMNGYGSNMAPSALADWVEYCALNGLCKPWQTLREIMRESGIPPALVDSFYEDESTLEDLLFDDADERAILEGDPALALDDETPYADTARTILEKRLSYLGDLYPFYFDELDRLKPKDDLDILQNAYLSFLRISVLKGWAYPLHRNILLPIANLFEQLIAESMRHAGMQAAVIGTSTKGSFDVKIKKCADDIGVECNPHAIAHSPRAKDEGVDIIGGFLSQDHRIGEPLWVIQAACGKGGDSWESKLMHIDLGKWSSYLCNRSMPHAFLAVPYHLTDSALDDFMHHQDARSFLDRLRLVHMAGEATLFDDAELASLNEEVVQIESDWLQGDLG